MTLHERFDAPAEPAYLNDVYLRPGDALLVYGKRYVVQSRCSDPVGYFVEDPLAPDGGVPFASARIKALQLRGELTIVAREQDDPGIPIGVRRNMRRDLAGFPPAKRREMLRRVRYCMALDRLGQGFSRSERVIQPICDEIAAERADDGAHDWATVYRWWRIWVRSGRNPSALAPRHDEKGNRTSRLVDGVEEIIRETVATWFLRPGARMATTCHAAFFHALEEKYGSAKNVWKAHDEALRSGRILVVGEAGFAKRATAVRRDIRLARRHGNKLAREAITPIGVGPVARFPFERVEADFKYMTLFVVDDVTGAPLGVPYLMAAVDNYSGCAAGWDLGFDPPSYVSASRCLRHVISFKDTSMFVNDVGEPVIRNQLPCNGVPFQFVLDNDQVFHSESFEQSAKALGCHVDYLRPGDPGSKGKVERLFRTVETYLDGLDGKKVKVVRKLGTNFDPLDFARVSLSELRMMLAKAFADVHHEREEPGTFKRRLDLWSEGVEIRPPRPVPNHGDLVDLVGGYKDRKADRRGVRLFGLYYNSSELAEYRAGFEEDPRVEVRYDPDDISRVRVIDRKKRTSFSVPCTRVDYVLPTVALGNGREEVPLTLHQHRVITRRAKELGGSGAVRYRRLLEARAELFALGKEIMAKRKGRGYRQRFVRFFGPHIEKAAEVSRRRFDPEESQKPLTPSLLDDLDDVEILDDDEEEEGGGGSGQEACAEVAGDLPEPDLGDVAEASAPAPARRRAKAAPRPRRENRPAAPEPAGVPPTPKQVAPAGGRDLVPLRPEMFDAPPERPPPSTHDPAPPTGSADPPSRPRRHIPLIIFGEER